MQWVEHYFFIGATNLVVLWLIFFIFSHHAQVVYDGLTVNEDLEATYFPCHKKHLYKRVKAKQGRLAAVAREGAMTVLAEVAINANDICDVLSVTTPSPSKEGDEGAKISTQSQKTRKKIQKGMEDGMNLFSRDTTSMTTLLSSSVASVNWPPCPRGMPLLTKKFDICWERVG